MGKIAIVGVEGSGKTVLMAGLSECYKQISDTEPYLMPENQAAFMFMQQIPHKLRVDREWPEQTRIDSLRLMQWTLRYGSEILGEIEMLDYPGELYRIAFGEHTEAEADAVRPELDEFLEHVTGADTLVVLLNLAHLDDLGVSSRNAETVWITRGIFDFAKKLPNIKRKLLAFTQADRYADEVRSAGGAEALFASKLSMLKTLNPELKAIAVSAVDGMDADGRPKEGYSVAGCLEFMRGMLVEEDREIKECLAKCDSLLNQIKEFNSGNAELFNTLVDTYVKACEELQQKMKPLKQVYQEVFEKHAQEAGLCLRLKDAIQRCVSKHSIKQLANSSVWIESLAGFDNFEYLISAFCKFYMAIANRYNSKERPSKEENNSKERQIKEQKNGPFVR